MKTLLTAVFSLALSAQAQTLNLNLDALSARAKQKVEIMLDGSTIAQALQTAPEKVKNSVANVSRFFLRHYEFDKPGAYSDADLDAVRKQVSAGSGWSRILSTKEDQESVDIYVLNQGGKPGGFLLIAAEKKELTVVHVVGSIDLASLQEVVKSTIAYDISKAGAQEGAH